MNDPQILFPYHRGCQEAILLIMEHRGKTPIPLSSPNSIYLSYKLQTTSLNNLRKYTYCVSFKYTLLSITMPPTQDYHGHYKFRICTAHRPGKHMGVFWKWRTVAKTLEVMVKWDKEDNWVVLKTSISWKAYEQRGGEGGQSFAMLVIPCHAPCNGDENKLASSKLR